MFRVINRTQGFIFLPNGERLKSQRSTTVDFLNNEILKMQDRKLLSIHPIGEKELQWVKYEVDLFNVVINEKSPDLTSIQNGSLALIFKNGRDTELDFEMELPPKYIIGSDLKPQIHWNLDNPGNYGNVLWIIEFSALNNWVQFKKDTLTSNVPIPLNMGDVELDLPKISGGGFKYNTLIKGKLIRKGTKDTYNLPAVIPQFNIGYQIEKSPEVIFNKYE